MDTTHRHQDLMDGNERLHAVLTARTILARGGTWNEVQRATGLHIPTIYKWCRKVEQIERPTVADLATRKPSGRSRSQSLREETVATLQRNYLITNRTSLTGSAQEAVRMALRKGEISETEAEIFRAREAAGLPLLTDAQRREIIVPPVLVKQSRNATDADLDYLYCPGSSMHFEDPITGEQRPAQVGDILEMDDGTINFCACVPWEIGGTPCADKFKVLVGRFQWLPMIDAASRFPAGFSYTARFKSSYRAEDITSTLHAAFRQHGLWKECRFEKGSFGSNLVKHTLSALNIHLNNIHRPRSKPFIEGLFNKMWLKLSDIPGQVGRFMGEQEAENKLLVSCQGGHTDPRKYFPMLNIVVDNLQRVLEEHSNQRITSRNYGSWIPRERWEAGQSNLRPYDLTSAWMFSPVIRTWMVHGTVVKGSVQIMDKFSIEYHFTADWLYEFHGAKVRVFFDPFSPNCTATLVLDQRLRDHKPGEVLGQAMQINKVARDMRKAMGWGDDPDLGYELMKRNSTALRREVRAITSGNKPAVRTTTIRDGAGNSVTIDQGPNIQPRATSSPEPTPTVVRATGNADAVVPQPTRARSWRIEMLEEETA